VPNRERNFGKPGEFLNRMIKRSMDFKVCTDGLSVCIMNKKFINIMFYYKKNNLNKKA